MLQAEARQQILDRFRVWRHETGVVNPVERDAWHFCALLSTEQSPLLGFHCRGDRYQKIKSWLLEEGLIAG